MLTFSFHDNYVTCKGTDQTQRTKTQCNRLLKDQGFWWNSELYCWCIFGLYVNESIIEKAKFLDEVNGSARRILSFKKQLEKKEWMSPLNIKMDEKLFKLPPLPNNRRKQLRIINNILKYEGAIINAGVGSGKTYCTITAFNHLQHHGVADKMFVVTLGSVLLNWKKEILKFSWIKEDEIFVMDSKKNRDPWTNSDKYKVILCTYQNFKVLINDIYKKKGYSFKSRKYERKYCFFEEFSKWSDNFQFVVDESHFINKNNSINNKYVTAISRIASHVTDLTGSLYRQFLNEIYFHINLVCPELVDNFPDKSDSYDNFLKVTAELASEHSTTIKKTKLEMMEYLNSIYYRYITKSTVNLDVDTSFVKVEVELSRRHMNFYKNVAQMILKNSNPEEGITTNEFFNAFPLYSQSLADPLMVKDKYQKELESFEWSLDDNIKFQTILKLIEKHKEDKKIIWLRNPFVLDLLEEKLQELGYKTIKCHGEVKPPRGVSKNEHKQILVDEFNSNPEIEIGLFNASSLGTGQNLDSACVDFFFNIPNNIVDDYLQAVGRTARPTQKKDITHYIIVAKDTIDETAYYTLNHRSYLNDLKAKYTYLNKEQIKSMLTGEVID